MSKAPIRDFLQPQTNYVEWLESEHERLREALRQIADDATTPTVDDAYAIARRALGEEEA